MMNDGIVDSSTIAAKNCAMRLGWRIAGSARIAPVASVAPTPAHR